MIDGAIVLFLTIIVAMCVAMFLILRKTVEKARKEYEKSRVVVKTKEKTEKPSESSSIPPVPDHSKLKKKASPDKIKEVPIDPNKVSIYTYRPTEKRCTCPYCDGENLEAAAVCVICGHALR